MRTTFTPESTSSVIERLHQANSALLIDYPGDSSARQPVHTMYGGAQIFKAETAQKLGGVALKSLEQYGPDFLSFAHALDLHERLRLPSSASEISSLVQLLERDPDSAKTRNYDVWLVHTVYRRVIEKLRTEPVEDFRIDFEDGYGNRPDEEEDHHAQTAAEEVARGMAEGILPPFIGIRVKPFTEELKTRGIRTLDIFMTTLAEKTGGKLPPHFVITLPKVTMPAHVTALVDLCKVLERKTAFQPGSLNIELMVETPQAIVNHQGHSNLPLLIAAGEGRCKGAHFGVYDYTALVDITAAYQSITHPSCDFARHMMKVALAGTGIWLSDGATTIMPIAKHRASKEGPALTEQQERENREGIHRGWKLAFDDVNHSLKQGYYQGWDLHPAQLPIRYAAVYLFFLEGLDAASMRLKTFIDKAAQATLIGDTFDDAATGQGLLNFFLRGIGCRAITEAEAQVTGLSVDELRSRSFMKIVTGRRGRHSKAAAST